jgi:hypothetical protein
LVPLRAGDLTVPDSRLIFEDTVFEDAVTFPAAPPALQVMPVPDPPENFSGWVGRVQASLGADRSTVGLGEPLEVVLRLSGDALFATRPVPDLILSGRWRTFRRPTRTSAPDPLTGFSVMEIPWTLVPDRAGRQSIAVELVTVFDPVTATYYVVAPEPLQIDVLPDANGRLERDISRPETQPSRLFALPVAAVNPVNTPSHILWAGVALAGVSSVVGVSALRRQARIRRQSRIRRALPRARAAVQTALTQSDPSQVKARLELALTRLASDRWPAPSEPPVILRSTVEDLRFAPPAVLDHQTLSRAMTDLFEALDSIPGGDV